MVRLVKGMCAKRPKDKRDVWAPDRPLADVRQLLGTRGHEYFEVLDPNHYGKLYLDRDEVLPADVKDISGDLLAAKRAEVKARVESLLGPALADGSVTFKIAERHGFCEPKGRWKLSFRPYVSGLRVKHVDIPRLLDSMHGNADGFWDTSVYKAGEQLMACVNGRKSGKDRRILRMQADGDDVADYLIQVVEDEWVHYEGALNTEEVATELPPRPSDIKQAGICCPEGQPPKEDTGTLEDEAFVHDVVSCLSSTRAESYTDWRNTGFALKLASQGTDKYLGLFKAFSRRSAQHQKAADQDACEKLWRASAPNAGSPVVTLGTLITWAKQDDPVAIEAARERRRARRQAEPESLQPKNMQDVMETAKKLHEVLELPSCIQRVVDSSIEDKTLAITTDLQDGQSVRVRVNCETLYVQAYLSDQLVAERYLNDSQATALRIKDVDLSSVHKDLRSDMEWRVSRPNDSKAVFLTHGSDTQNATIEMLNMNTPGHLAARLEFKDSRKTVAVKKSTIPLLQTAYTGAVQNALRGDLGMGWVIQAINNGIINSGSGTININIQGKGDVDPGRHTDDQLAMLVIQAHPDMAKRLRCVPDVKTNNCNGLFYCDPASNIWAQTANIVIEEKLIALCQGTALSNSLSAADRKHVSSRRGRDDLRYCVASKVVDSSFLSRLDENLDTFVVGNGCFDMSDEMDPTKRFRPLQMEDYVTKTAGWDYCPLEAATHRAAVEEFMAQVWPVDAERHIVLSFFASLLSGRRRAKKFLVLTDRRSGNNGKTTALELLRGVIGDKNTEMNTKFVCKGAFDRDRDSHDAGTEPFQGKRLVIAEELKHTMKLDDAMLKRLTGGDGITVSGRRCGSGSRYQFTWQAGIILVFNEGDCPQFDINDTAFMERMLVAPMRSKFMEGAAACAEPWTFEINYDIKQRFPAWRSAVIDILLEHYGSPSVFQSVPLDMKTWKISLTTDSNPLATWLEDNVVITGDRTDTLAFTREVAMLCTSLVPYREFNKYVKAFFVTRSLEFKDKHNGVRNVVMGCAWAPGCPKDASEGTW